MSDDYQALPDILASRLNFDVIAFRGCTRKELMVIGAVSFLSCAMVFGVLMKVLFGVFLIGVGIACPLSIAVGFLMTTVMQTLKMGKPKGYLKQCLLLCLDECGLIKLPFSRYSGPWQVKRVFEQE